MIYLDEFVITSKTYQDRTWMFKNRPFEIDYRMNQVKPIAVILAVSVSQGVDLYMSFEKSVDQKKFCQFLRRLRKKYPDRKFCALQDNLNVHRSKQVTKLMADPDIPVVWNAPYSPQFNAVEYMIGVIKQNYKKNKLNKILNGTNETERELLAKAVKKVTPSMVESTVNHAVALL